MVVTSITVVDLPDERPRPLARINLSPRHVALALGGAGLLAIAAIALAVFLTGGSTGAHRASVLPLAERRAIAGALGYPYPLRCLTIAVSADDPDYATAEIDRRTGCGQYRGYIYASLHRVGGGWRLLLDEGQLYIGNLLSGPPTTGNAYPLGCLSAQTLAQVPAFARAGLARGVCARPGSSIER
ncbi:MAG TPA: hypothetical protein VMD09_15775 [Solirubrobacteraceae bacterium]|nr:hypothetical protein [Solirubrobacteraceae bacterium]